MFDAHCHFPFEDCICCSDELLPQNIKLPLDYSLTGKSEAGLDRRFENLIPLEKQADILQDIFMFAKNNAIPVSLHCVRATGLMLDLLKKIQPLPHTVLWHGFNGSPETASILKKLEVIISVGPLFRRNVKEIYRANDNLVLETDYSGTDAEKHSAVLSALYERTALELNISISGLEKLCRANAAHFTSVTSRISQ